MCVLVGLMVSQSAAWAASARRCPGTQRLTRLVRVDPPTFTASATVTSPVMEVSLRTSVSSPVVVREPMSESAPGVTADRAESPHADSADHIAHTHTTHDIVDGDTHSGTIISTTMQANNMKKEDRKDDGLGLTHPHHRESDAQKESASAAEAADSSLLKSEHASHGPPREEIQSPRTIAASHSFAASDPLQPPTATVKVEPATAAIPLPPPVCAVVIPVVMDGVISSAPTPPIVSVRSHHHSPERVGSDTRMQEQLHHGITSPTMRDTNEAEAPLRPSADSSSFVRDAAAGESAAPPAPSSSEPAGVVSAAAAASSPDHTVSAPVEVIVDSDDESDDDADSPDKGTDVPASASTSDLSSVHPHHQQHGKKEKGVSCHQCKTSKDGSVLLFCVNKAEKGKRKRNCRKKYCDACLRRAYNMTIENFTQDEIDHWQCPACHSKCVCAACSRKHDIALQTSQKLAAAAAMQHVAAAAHAMHMPQFGANSLGLMSLRPNMAMMQFAAAATMRNFSQDQRAALAKATPVPATIPTGTPAATAASVVSAIVTTPNSQLPTPTPATPVTTAATVATPVAQTAQSAPAASDAKLPIVPIPISAASSQSLQQSAAASVMVPSTASHRTSSTVTAVAVPSQTAAHTGVVLANLAVVTSGDLPSRASPSATIARPRAFSCPTSPVRQQQPGTSAFTFPSSAAPSKPPPRMPIPATVQVTQRQLSSTRTTADGGEMPQRHRRHSLKVTPMRGKKAQYHGTIAHNQMLQSQQQQLAQEPPMHESQAAGHASRYIDAHADLVLPSSFSQGMSIASHSREEPHTQPAESFYLHSAPVSPTHRGRHSATTVLPTPIAHAVQPSGPVLAAIEISSHSNASHSTSRTPNSEDPEDDNMMILSPHQHQPQQHQQDESHQYLRAIHPPVMDMLHSPPNHLPTQQAAQAQPTSHGRGFGAPVHRTSPQASPHASPQSGSYHHSLLSTYLQQQHHHPQQYHRHNPATQYGHSSQYPGSPTSTLPSELEFLPPNSALLESLAQMGQSSGRADGSLDAAAAATTGDAHAATDSDTINLRMNLDDPSQVSATLQTINQLQVTLQSVINSKTAQAHANQNLQQLVQQQQQYQHSIQAYQPHHHHLHVPPMPVYLSQPDGGVMDLVPFTSDLDSHADPSDLMGIDPFPGGPHGGEHLYASSEHAPGGQTSDSRPVSSPTFAFTSSQAIYGIPMQPHAGQKHALAHTATMGYFGASPNTSPNHHHAHPFMSVAASMAHETTSTATHFHAMDGSALTHSHAHHHHQQQQRHQHHDGPRETPPSSHTHLHLQSDDEVTDLHRLSTSSSSMPLAIGASPAASPTEELVSVHSARRHQSHVHMTTTQDSDSDTHGQARHD